jgi:hypothetical protein
VGPAEPPSQCYWELFPQVNRPDLETDHAYPSVTEVKNSWSSASILPYSFVAGYLIKQTDVLAVSLSYTTSGNSFFSFHLLVFISVK